MGESLIRWTCNRSDKRLSYVQVFEIQAVVSCAVFQLNIREKKEFIVLIDSAFKGNKLLCL